MQNETNWTDFYTQGFIVKKLDQIFYKAIMDELKKLNWQDDPSGIFEKIWLRDEPAPLLKDNFERERALNEWSVKHCPKRLGQIINRVAHHEKVGGRLLDFLQLDELEYIDAWKGAEDIGWHWDGPARSRAFAVLYMTDQKWKEEYGGGIFAGIRDELPENWWTDYSTVRTLGRISPEPGTLVFINNTDPRFVHAPEVLEPGAPTRLTMTFGFKSKED